MAIGIVLLMLGIGAIVLNWAWLTSRRVELRQASEAAALAGAAQLLDPTPDAAFTPQIQQATTSRVAAAKSQAATVFAANCRAVLNTGTADPDIVVGWCDDPISPGDVFTPWTDTGAVNAIAVRGMLRRSAGQSVAVWFGNLFGVSDAEPAARAIASMDQRVYGFRPVKFVNVPLVPLLLPDDAPWPSAAAGDSSTLADQYRIDERTRSVSSGTDQRGEFVLALPLAGSSAAASGPFWLRLDPTNVSWTRLADQVRLGLAPSDLDSVDGQLVSGETIQSLTIFPLPDASQAAVLLSAFQAIKGQQRIWPRGSVTVTNGQTNCQISDFVAGCVVDCSVTNNALTLVVQPCTLQTCTALLQSDMPRNPWIGKLILNQ